MNFAKIRDEHWNKANEIILKKSPKLEAPLNILHTKVCLIYREILDPLRIMYRIKEEYKNFMDKYGLNSVREDVLAEISQMPCELLSKNSFLSYARRYYNDGEVVSYVIKPFMESIEHINALFDGGTNNIANIIVMCRKCNNDRKNDPYPEHLAIHPEMIGNTEWQIKFYADRILSGELPAILEGYPINVAKTLSQRSDGLMDYNVDDYIAALSKNIRGVNS